MKVIKNVGKLNLFVMLSDHLPIKDVNQEAETEITTIDSTHNNDNSNNTNNNIINSNNTSKGKDPWMII